MEKRSAHYRLPYVQSLVRSGKVRTTWTALSGGAALGIDFAGICAIVLSLKAADFYKSMTTHADHRVWQDVYRPDTDIGKLYLKLTVVDDVMIVSFKEL